MQSTGYKHSTRWSFGDVIWHKVTKDKGIIFGIQLRHGDEPRYLVVFEDSRSEACCVEFELTEEEQTKVDIK